MDRKNFPYPASPIIEAKESSGGASASAALPGQGEDLPRRHRFSVLAVDDEENFLTLLHWFLSDRGYEVHTASSAEAAMNLVRERTFQLALLDVKIGSANEGLALLAELKERLPDIKVVMMTAYPTVSAIKQAFDRGATRFLTKPVDLKELAATLQALLQPSDVGS